MKCGWVPWLTPVINNTWDAEIKKIVVPGHPRQKKFPKPHLNGKNLSTVAHACHPSLK
jgi:hypothetical protein